MKSTTFAVLVVIAVAMMAGSAMAVLPVTATVGTSTVTSATSIQATGTVTQSDTLTWIQTNDPNGVPPLETAIGTSEHEHDGHYGASVGDDMEPTGDPGQIRYTAGYTAANRMIQGTTVLTKSVAVASAAQIADHQNIQTSTLLTYAAANEAGQAVGSEDILVDGVGANVNGETTIWSPFGAVPDNMIPPFAAMSNAGSSYNILLGTIDTAAAERFVATSADVPVSQTYSVLGRGITSATGTAPMVGSMAAYMNSHVQEGIIEKEVHHHDTDYEIGLGSDISYSSAVSAAGSISSFSQAYTFTGVK